MLKWFQSLLQGYHFPDGPYVGTSKNTNHDTSDLHGIYYIEYIGNIPAEKRDQALKDINREAMRLVQVYTLSIRRNWDGK